jgi:hypothetical protein
VHGPQVVGDEREMPWRNGGHHLLSVEQIRSWGRLSVGRLDPTGRGDASLPLFLKRLSDHYRPHSEFCGSCQVSPGSKARLATTYLTHVCNPPWQRRSASGPKGAALTPRRYRRAWGERAPAPERDRSQDLPRSITRRRRDR